MWRKSCAREYNKYVHTQVGTIFGMPSTITEIALQAIQKCKHKKHIDGAEEGTIIGTRGKTSCSLGERKKITTFY